MQMMYTHNLQQNLCIFLFAKLSFKLWSDSMMMVIYTVAKVTIGTEKPVVIGKSIPASFRL